MPVFIYIYITFGMHARLLICNVRVGGERVEGGVGVCVCVCEAHTHTHQI